MRNTIVVVMLLCLFITACQVIPTSTDQRDSQTALRTSPLGQQTAVPIPATVTPPAAVPIRLNPTAKVHYERGFAYFQQKQWELAILEFQQTIKLQPTFSLAHEGLGYSLFHGRRDVASAIEALQTYLQLTPTARDRTKVEAHIEQMRLFLIAQAAPGFEFPPGKALFLMANYTAKPWQVQVGPYIFEMAAKPPDQAYSVTSIALEPGVYTWQATSTDGDAYVADSTGNEVFEVNVAAGDIYPARLRDLPNGASLPLADSDS